MKDFEFSIIASGLDPSAEDFEARFYDAGCDDATVSFQKGHIIVDFARESEAIEDAITSALECVTKAGAHADRIEPDPLVNLSEIASRAGLTRAALTQYAKGQRGKGDFPAPVVKITSDSSLWDWSTVARWLFRYGKASRDLTIEAEAVKQANEAIESADPDIGTRMREHMREYRAAI